ncbi:MAG: chemotaxis protein CheW [Pseudomonadales bacterium]
MDIDVPEVIAAEGNLEGIEFITSGEQFLAFILGKEHYAIDILSVKEIRGWEHPTMIPHSQTYMKGVINIRGMIVPIVDLRLRFSVGEVIYDASTVVIVLTHEVEKVPRTIGFVVDAVSDVLNAEESDIKKSPSFGNAIPLHYIRGLVNVDKNVVTLLNIEYLMTLEE